MTAYNSGRFINEAISSVLNQSFDDFELIVIDDGSEDNTRKIVEHRLTDPRVSYIYQNNAGDVTARNTGIRAAKGSFIAFCDSDDMWHPEKLAIQVPALETTPELGLIHTARTAINATGAAVGRKHKHDTSGILTIENSTRRLVHRNFVCGSSILIRRECFDKIGFFDESFLLSYDHEFLLRLSLEYPFGYIDQELYVYRKHDNQATANRELREQYKEKVLDRFLELFPDAVSTRDIDIAYANIHKSRGNDLIKQDRDPIGARIEYLRSLRRLPFNPSVWFKLLRTYLA